MIEGIGEAIVAFAKEIEKLDCKPRMVQLKIDGITYTSHKLPATVGLELGPRIVALLGAGLTRALATGQFVGLDGSAIVAVADRAMRDGLVPLIRDLMIRIECDQLSGLKTGGKVLDDFDEHFAGEYPHLFKVAAFALAHNLKGPTYGTR